MSSRPITPRTFEFTTPAVNWTIEHNLAAFPIVDVFLMLDGELHKVIPKGVTYVNANNCVVEFSTPRAGTAVLV